MWCQLANQMGAASLEIIVLVSPTILLASISETPLPQNCRNGGHFVDLLSQNPLPYPTIVINNIYMRKQKKKMSVYMKGDALAEFLPDIWAQYHPVVR